MKESSKEKIKEILFCIVFILSCLTTDSDKLPLNYSSESIEFIILKFFLIILSLFIVTYINKNNVEFIAEFVKPTILIITVLLIIDFYTVHISGSQFLYRVWWIAYIIVAGTVVFITLSIYKPRNYELFYYNFWKSLTPLYLFSLYLCFIRKPFTGLSTNFKLGQGTFIYMKVILTGNCHGFEAYLLLFGNLIILLPLPFILSAFFKKIKPCQLALTGFAAPFIIEGYQYFLKCGNVDIDDVVLNWLGYFIGFGIYLIIKKRLLTKSE